MKIKVFGRIVIAFLLVAALCVGIYLLLKQQPTASTKSIRINEIMTKNDGLCPDPNGNYFDWIELYNASDKDVSIAGYGLSDGLNNGISFVFKSGSVIPANGYIVVYCSDDSSMGALYASFKLSDGDTVILYDAHGANIDHVDLKPVQSTMSLGIVGATEEWKEYAPTPGFNNDTGLADYTAYKEALLANTVSKVVSSDIVINELMPSNYTTIADSYGLYSDWVEIYNKSNAPIDISGFMLSDDEGDHTKFVFPEGTSLEAHGFILVFCSGFESKGTELHAPFKLSSKGESVLLSDKDGNLIDKIIYEPIEGDTSLARSTDGTGEFVNSVLPTPGYPNTQDGATAFASASRKALTVIISEAVGDTDVSLEGASEVYDWVELYNATSAAINLEGYSITDTPKNPLKWVFPETTLKAGDYLVICASSLNIKNTLTDGYLHTNFSLGSEGEGLYLFDSDGLCIHKLVATRFPLNMSVGVNSDGAVRYYGTLTPGEANPSDSDDKVYTDITDAPDLLTAPGVYDSEITVTLSCKSDETIYYTLDCTTPTTNSLKYSGPITVSSNTVIRAFTYKKGSYTQLSTCAGTYLFTTDNVNHALPIISLVTDPDILFDEETGIFMYGPTWDPENDDWPYWKSKANFWSEEEFPASFELFGDDDKLAFSQNVGFKISGSYGRGCEQKGIAVTARDEYGDNTLSYPFFDNLDYTEYKSLLLRCGAQDQGRSKIRDELSASLLYDTDVNFLYQSYKPYVLYINGRYWGVYFLREKRNRFYVAQHEGIEDSTKMNLIKSVKYVQYGDSADWKSLMDFVMTHDLTVQDNYNHVADNIDLNSFMDYLICEIYVGNTDYWNIQMYKLDDGKWKFIYYDFCWGWDYTQHNTLAARRESAQPCSDLFNALLENEEWRDAFIKRFAEIMNTVYEPERVLAKIDEFYELVEPEIARERSIFNSASSEYFTYVDPHNISSYDRFNQQIDYIRSFAKNRADYIKKHIKAEFNLSDAEMKEVFSDGG